MRDKLTPRQIEIVRLMAQGYSNPEIARELCMSIRTVQCHCTQIYSRLRVGTRTEAVVLGLNHLIPLEEAQRRVRERTQKIYAY